MTSWSSPSNKSSQWPTAWWLLCWWHTMRMHMMNRQISNLFRKPSYRKSSPRYSHWLWKSQDVKIKIWMWRIPCKNFILCKILWSPANHILCTKAHIKHYGIEKLVRWLFLTRNILCTKHKRRLLFILWPQIGIKRLGYTWSQVLE
jgi:hypothetical protein